MRRRHMHTPYTDLVCARAGVGSFFLPASSQGTVLTELAPDDAEYQQVEEQMQGSIREHKDNSGGYFYKYSIAKVRAPHPAPLAIPPV